MTDETENDPLKPFIDSRSCFRQLDLPNHPSVSLSDPLNMAYAICDGACQ